MNRTDKPNIASDVQDAHGVDTPAAAVGAEARKSTLVRSGATTVAGQFANVVIATGATIVLARLLNPADFGLLAMVYSLIMFIGSFRDFGLPMAALQSRDMDHLKSSALFWINFRITLGVTLLMILMGPVLAWFYNEPRLTVLTWVMSAGVLAPALANQHEAMLMRRLKFISLVKLDIGFLFAGAVAAIGLAAGGFGHWALVAQFLIWQVGRAVAVWLASGWTPAAFGAARGTWKQVRPLVSIGAHLTGFRFISHAGRDLDRVLVGYIGGVVSIGLYDAALRWARLPLQQIFTPLLGVAVAGLSHLRDDADAYRRSLRAVLAPVLGLSIPMLTFAVVVADDIILILLGAKWAGAIPLFRILCVGTIALAAYKTTKWIYVSLGQTKRQFRWALLLAPVFAAGIVAGSFYGPQGIAIGFATVQWVVLLPSLAYCLHGSPVRLRQYLTILARPVLASAVAAATAWTIDAAVNADGHAKSLLLAAGVFAPTYIATWLALPGGRGAGRDVLNLIKRLRPAAPTVNGARSRATSPA